MGNQGSANDGLRRAVEVIQAGLIGNVTQVHVWSNRPIWPQGIERPSGEDPVPEGMDWDMWLGPAPARPFKKNVYHTFNWRGYMDFGTGALGDMACHTCNLPFRALKLGYPTEIESETLDMTADCYPIKSKIRFEFPAREGLAPVTFRWYDGGNPGSSRASKYHDGNNKPAKEVLVNVAALQDQIPQSGCLMIGDKGEIFSDDDYGTRFFLKLSDDKEYRPGSSHPAVAAIPESIARNKFMHVPGVRADSDHAQHQEWIAACKGGDPGYSNFDIAAYLTEIILLGCVAMRSGKKLEWDGPNMLALNAPEASQFVHPNFRDAWKM
jgi:predicted dehydrogenase